MSSLQKRVMFTGKAGHGKTTSAKILESKYNFIRLNFASGIKQIISQIFGVPEKYIHDDKYKNTIIPELGVSYRSLAQVIGTELFRVKLLECLPTLKLKGEATVWIHHMLHMLNNNSTQNIVIDDGRFHDEYAMAKSQGFIVIKIVNPRVPDIPNSGHASEMGCPCDHEIINDGTLEELEQKILSIINLPTLPNKDICGDIDQEYNLLVSDLECQVLYNSIEFLIQQLLEGKIISHFSEIPGLLKKQDEILKIIDDYDQKHYRYFTGAAATIGMNIGKSPQEYRKQLYEAFAFAAGSFNPFNKFTK
jgi:energy-coupling factor transporter ATP-binding protein EcfA2